MAKIEQIQVEADLAYNANATFTLTRKSFHHQVTVETSAAAAGGTLSVQMKYTSTSAWEIPVDINGDELVIDMTNPKTFTIDGWIEELQLVPTAFDAEKTYTVTCISGNI